MRGAGSVEPGEGYRLPRGERVADDIDLPDPGAGVVVDGQRDEVELRRVDRVRDVDDRLGGEVPVPVIDDCAIGDSDVCCGVGIEAPAELFDGRDDGGEVVQEDDRRADDLRIRLVQASAPNLVGDAVGDGEPSVPVLHGAATRHRPRPYAAATTGLT